MARLVEQVNALRARAMSGEDFEGMEREFRALFAEAEHEVVGETLERLDVDLPCRDGGAAVPPGARSHTTYTSAAGVGGSASHAVLVRSGACDGADGAAGGVIGRGWWRVRRAWWWRT